MRTALIDTRASAPADLVFETFFNVADRQQRREYALLATQRALTIVGYDETLTRTLAKRVAITNGPMIAQTLAAADAIRAAIPAPQYDFDRAKAIVVAHTAL